MLIRGFPLAGPYPISRDGKRIGQFLQAAIVLLPDDKRIADVEVATVADGKSIAVTFKLKSGDDIQVHPGYQVTVRANRTFDVDDYAAGISAHFIFPIH